MLLVLYANPVVTSALTFLTFKLVDIFGKFPKSILNLHILYIKSEISTIFFEIAKNFLPYMSKHLATFFSLTL